MDLEKMPEKNGETLEVIAGALLLRLSYALDRDGPRILSAMSKLKEVRHFGKMKESLPGSSNSATGNLNKREMTDAEWAGFLIASAGIVLHKTSGHSFFSKPTAVGDLVVQINIDGWEQKRQYTQSVSYTEKKEYARRKVLEYVKFVEEHYRKVAPTLLVSASKSDAGYVRFRAMMGLEHLMGNRKTKVRLGTTKKAPPLAVLPPLARAKLVGAQQLKKSGMATPARGLRKAAAAGALPDAVGSEMFEICNIDLLGDDTDDQIIGVIRSLTDWIGMELTLAYQAVGTGAHGELNVDLVRDPS